MIGIDLCLYLLFSVFMILRGGGFWDVGSEEGTLLSAFVFDLMLQSFPNGGCTNS